MRDRAPCIGLIAKEALRTATERAVMLVPQVTIMCPARTASQQGQSKSSGGQGKGPAWRIEFEPGPK